MAFRLRIGSRPSPLALVQAHAVKRAIEERIGTAAIEIVTISTTGDKMTSASLARIGGKGLFVRELEQALIDGRIDIAVHSLKDLPARLPDQFRIVAVPAREDPCDGLLMRRKIDSADARQPWQALRRGARVGTSSSRRKYELLRQRPDLQIEPLRGNVDTRLRRLAEGEFDAIVLAIAGLKRLDKIDPPDGIIVAPLDEGDFVPAGGQGALAIEALQNGAIGSTAELEQAIAGLDDGATRAEVMAERGFLATIGASCVSPVGVKGTFSAGRLALRALLFSVDGAKHMAESHEIRFVAGHDREEQAHKCGETLGQRMLAAGADTLIGEL
jgi:hydroxymethylbilane synthase